MSQEPSPATRGEPAPDDFRDPLIPAESQPSTTHTSLVERLDTMVAVLMDKTGELPIPDDCNVPALMHEAAEVLRCMLSETPFINQWAGTEIIFDAEAQAGSPDISARTDEGPAAAAPYTGEVQGRVSVPSAIREKTEAQVALKAALPYLEGLAEKLAICANTPEVIALHELIVKSRMAL